MLEEESQLLVGCTEAEAISILQAFGYSEIESRFLYLVVIHSGYFTRSQFLRFSGKSKGWAVHRFTEKLRARGHAAVTELGRGIYLFQLCSRQIYDDLERPNLRIRSLCSEEFIRARLLTLDFVMAHLGVKYLETSEQKVAFFTERIGLPIEILPGKVYSGIASLRNKTRYFTDRFPIFLEAGDSPDALLRRPVFVYCDPYPRAFDAFKTHLKRYEKLLRSLPRFRFIYASPQPRKFTRAKRTLDNLMRPEAQVDAWELLRYFKIRRLWEVGDTAELTREHRELLRRGDQKFQGEPYSSIYRKWFWNPGGETEVRVSLGASGSCPTYTFESYYLPESYDIFRYESTAPNRTKRRTVPETRWSGDGSVFHSSEQDEGYL